MPEILGRRVGGIGYGMLGLTTRSVVPPEEQAFATMRATLNKGCNFWNGGEFYGPPDRNSLTLLRKYYEKYPEDADNIVLNIKGATRILPTLRPDGSPEFVKESVYKCLEMLGPRGRIDMFECARRDPNVPLEKTLGALAELVQAGKIGGIALSEVNAGTIREAAKITKIVAVEIELSLWRTEPLTNGIATACAELDIPIIAYSPVGHGFLTGQIKSYADIPEKDHRRLLPRFQPENLDVNMKLVHELEAIAAKKRSTMAQLAIGWLRAISKRQGMPEIIPIPGATTKEKVEENGTEFELTEVEMGEIEEVLRRCEVVGDRYHAEGMKMVDG